MQVKLSRIFLVDFFLITIYIIVFSWPLGVFWGPVGYYSNFPKGDDAQMHAALTLFISKNWPHINWYPNWYSGLPIFLSYHPLAYFTWGLFVKTTGLSVATTLFLFTALSYILTAIALYVLIYKMTSNRYSAFLSSILLVTSGSFISPLLTGGIYTRMFATMFWMFSLYSLFCYMKDSGEKKHYIATIVLSAAAITSNMLIGLFCIITALLAVLACSRSITERIIVVLKIFVPIFMLSAFFYLPFLFFYLGKFFAFSVAGGHYSIPQPLIYLVAGSMVQLFLLFIATIVRRYIKFEFDFLTGRFLKVLLGLIVFFFFYGFTVLPPLLRFIATYDSTYFLSIYLSIYCSIVFGAIFNQISKEHAFPKNPNIVANLRLSMTKLRRKHLFPLAILMLGLTLPLSYYPLLMTYVVDSGAPSWHYPAYIAEQLISIDATGRNFRFSSDWVHVVRWFNYRYDYPQTEGVQAMAVLNPQWNSWFQEAVFTTSNNWIETNFLFDWYGVKWFLVSKVVHSSGGGEFFKRQGMIEKFSSKPEYYDVKSSVEVPSESYWNGPVFFFEYNEATPILSLNDAMTVLVVGDDAVYDKVFCSLAPSGYDSRFLVPVGGSAYIDDHSLDSLRKFDVVILSSYLYHNADSARKLLEDYVGEGGGLIIETGDINTFVLANVTPVNGTKEVSSQDWNFTYVSNTVAEWVDFEYFSMPIKFWVSTDQNVQSWAAVMLRSHGAPTVVMGEYGKGKVIYDGLRISDHAAMSKNSMESFFLAKLVEWVSNTEGKASINRVIGSELTENWVIYLGGRETFGSLKLSNNVTREEHSTLELGYSFNTTVAGGEYIEYKYTPNVVWDWRKMRFLSFWVYGDNSTNQLKTAILAPDWSNSFQVSMKLDWLGWRKVVIPFDIFGVIGFPTLTNVRGISFVIDETSEEAEKSEMWHQMYLDEISIVQLDDKNNISSEGFSNPNPELFKLTVNSSSGVLFKESFFQNWFAYLVDREGSSHDLDIFRAGPDFMYVLTPSDVKLPAEVVFEYRVSQIEKASYMLSFLTLVLLTLYGFWGQWRRLRTFLRSFTRKMINIRRREQEFKK
jgi:hypothetical protein